MDEVVQVRWWAGIDLGEATEHRVHLIDADGRQVGEAGFKHTGEDVTRLAKWLMDISGAQHSSQIAVGVEKPHGAVVETLLERGFHVYSINPKQLDRFRDRFSAAGAKDDRRDAKVAAHSLRTDRERFRRVGLSSPLELELREYSRMHDELTVERGQMANRIREQLLRYYPQALQLTNDFCCPWFMAIWKLAPTPAKAQRIRRSSIERVLKENRARQDAHELGVTLRAPAFTVAPGTTEAAVLHIEALMARAALVSQQLKACDKRIDRLLVELSQAPAEGNAPGQRAEQRDAAILLSLPGAGRIVVATLLSEAAAPIKTRDYETLRRITGVAPVTRQSGKRRVVSMRRACSERLRHAIHHWARSAIKVDPRSRARYTDLRAGGKEHAAALRIVGDRLLYVACAALRNQTLFDPAYPGSKVAA